MWTELGEPCPFDLIEYGAGSGTLGLSILEGLRRHGSTDLLAAIALRTRRIEPEPPGRLEDRFEKAGLAGLLAPAGSPSDGPVPVAGVILANEFLDALPVHRFVVRGGKLLELFVGWREGFVQVAAEPSTPELAGRLAGEAIVPDRLAEGQVGEICLGLAPWLDDVDRRLARGFVVAIDYGYEAAETLRPSPPRRNAARLSRPPRAGDPLAEVGRADLTAPRGLHRSPAPRERRGLRSVALTTQSEFLVDAGLESELQALQASTTTTVADYMRARSGIVRMLDPRHMGRSGS